MLALRFERPVSLDQLQLVDSSIPAVGRGEVLVRVHAGSMNRSDLSNVTGKFPYTTYPRIPGRDLAGVVVDGDPALVGRAIWASGKEIGFTRDGSHAEFVVLPAAAVAPKPKHLSFSAAAACGVPYITAWSALEQCQVGRDTRLLVIGAAGGVGVAALHLARERGARCLGAVRRAEQVARLASWGFEAISLDDAHSLDEVVRPIFPHRADVIIDCAGPWVPQSVGALAEYGKIAVMVVPAADGHINAPIRDLYRRGGSIVGVNSLLYSAAHSVKILESLRAGFDSGRLRPPDGIVEWPLDDAPAAYRALANGATGKFVLTPRTKESE